MVEFIKKHKIPLIILAVSVGLYLLYDYLTANAAANSSSAADDTDAADQAALQDELASLQSGTNGSLSSPVATSPAVGGIAASTPSPTSTGTAATDASGTTTSVANPSGVSTSLNSSTTTETPTSTALATPPYVSPGSAGSSASSQPASSLPYYGNPNAAADANLPPSNGPTDQLLAALQAGNPQAVAAQNQYNQMFTEADPQEASAIEASGLDPYIVWLDQQGGDVQTSNEAGLNAPGTQNILLPTFNLNDGSTTTEAGSTSGDGGQETGSAGASGSSASITRPGVSFPGVSSTITGTVGLPGAEGSQAIFQSTNRPLTTIPSSPTKGTAAQGPNSGSVGGSAGSVGASGSAGSAGGVPNKASVTTTAPTPAPVRPTPPVYQRT
jgi:hypothetical protein